MTQQKLRVVSTDTSVPASEDHESAADLQMAADVSSSYVVDADMQAEAVAIAAIPFRQLVEPSPKISCEPGMCLVYAREVFGVASKNPTAIKGWQNSQYKHENRKYPQDVWVPIWFSHADNPAGHVAVRQPDGSIWSASHPTASKPIQHESLEDMEQYYGHKLTHLGWTEDIEGVQVVGRV